MNERFLPLLPNVLGASRLVNRSQLFILSWRGDAESKVDELFHARVRNILHSGPLDNQHGNGGCDCVGQLANFNYIFIVKNVV